MYGKHISQREVTWSNKQLTLENRFVGNCRKRIDAKHYNIAMEAGLLNTQKTYK